MPLRQITAYTFRSRIGTFRLQLTRARRWDIWCNGDMLGTYSTAALALENLTAGTCDWPGTTDPATLGLPDALEHWTPGTLPPRY